MTDSNDIETCRICGWTYARDSANDKSKHQRHHRILAEGGLPLDVRELLKEVGWNIVHGSSTEMKTERKSDSGKRAILFGWWGRARANGIETEEFDQFMADQLEFIDAKTSGDSSLIDSTSMTKSKWDLYADGLAN